MQAFANGRVALTLEVANKMANAFAMHSPDHPTIAAFERLMAEMA
jgi:hypothetical protein